MEKLAQLGTTDLEISRHGFGAARIGDGVSLDQIENLLDSLLDLGITFIDTADCYTRSEELIGRYLGDRSGEFVIATKCGCISGGDGEEEYSRAVIERSNGWGSSVLISSSYTPIRPRCCAQAKRQMP